MEIHEKRTQEEQAAEPRGLGEHARGLASEYAHEQGWGLNEEERKKEAGGPQDIDGGTDYDYGARDFGDEPVNAARIKTGGDEEAARQKLDLGRQMKEEK